MDKAHEIQVRWEGDGFTVHPRYAKLCDAEFVVGEDYTVIVREARSSLSHRHFFASVNETFKNLPETETRFKSPEHLRKWALVQAGYADERHLVCDSASEAARIAKFMSKGEDYAIITVNGEVVHVFTPKSQSSRHMDKATFQRSKDDVLRILAGLIDVKPSELRDNAGKAA